MTLETLKLIVEIISYIVSSLAFIIGGYFAYRKFIKEKPLKARANFSQQVISKKINDRFTLINVILKIENVGNISLIAFEGFSRLHKIFPADKSFLEKLDCGKALEYDGTKTAYSWPAIAYLEYPFNEDIFRISPSEIENWYCDFIIPSDIQRIKVYSYMSFLPKDKNIGWDVTTYHDIFEEETK